MSAVHEAPRRHRWILLVIGVSVFLLLLGLGTWQVERLQWKEGLLAAMAERTAGGPAPLAEIEQQFAATGDVDYWPAEARGTFRHDGERHFLATHDGQSGFFVFTPLELPDGRFLFVNRGFVPYDRKDPTTRPASQTDAAMLIRGLARNPLAEKPSWLVPDNDPVKNVFYWKDLSLMSASAGLPEGAVVLPFFVDADATPVPGGLPIGGVTLLSLPNNHLQYAVTWYGLAAALAAVTIVMALRGRSDGGKDTHGRG
jgi:surfeit locus 1 family protein